MKLISQFNNPASEEYKSALGSAISTWGIFEAKVDTYLLFLRMYPPSVALGQDMRQNFTARAALFKLTAAMCFCSCPDLVLRLTKLMDRAMRIGLHRNRLVHGHVFDTPFDPGPHVFIYERGGRNIYLAPIDEIRKFEADAANLYSGLVDIFAMWGHEDRGLLTSAEREALRNFWSANIQNRPDPSAIAIPRRLLSFRK